jgi:hypothetical protein
MPKKHTHRTRLVGVRVNHEPRIHLSLPTEAILTFVCYECAEKIECEYRRIERPDSAAKSAR